LHLDASCDVGGCFIEVNAKGEVYLDTNSSRMIGQSTPSQEADCSLEGTTFTDLLTRFDESVAVEKGPYGLRRNISTDSLLDKHYAIANELIISTGVHIWPDR
jgi:hypothetical protein